MTETTTTKPVKFVKSKRMPFFEVLLDDLLELEEGLNDWEVEFVEKMSHWEGRFTVNQAQKIEQIWDKLIG